MDFQKWCLVVDHLMAVNCSTRIKTKQKNRKSASLLPASPSSCFSLEFVSSPSFSPSSFISSCVLHCPPLSHRTFLLGLFYFVFVNLVFLPTVAFVFYHKFMWLTSRLRQAERGRQSAELDNRLFKQDFGDKINSLQLEVEALTRQRWEGQLGQQGAVVGTARRESGLELAWLGLASVLYEQ